MGEDAVRPLWAEEIRTRRHRLCWSQRELARRLFLAADEKTRVQLPGRDSIVREIRFHERGEHRPGPVYAELYRRVWEIAFNGEGQAEASSLEGEDPARIVARARALTHSNVDDAVLDDAERSIAQVVGAYEGEGPWPLAQRMLLWRQTLHGLLDGRQSARQRRALFRLAAKASGLLGYMAVNLDKPSLCDAYCTEAELLAREAEDVELAMWAMGTRSFGLYYQGRYAEADQAADAGIRLAPSSPQAIRLLVNGRARALARMTGHNTEARRRIEEALTLSDISEGLPGGMSSCVAFTPYSPARTMANAATALLSLGDHTRVLEHTEALDSLVEESDSRWSKALVRLDTASALLTQRDPDVGRALELGHQALSMTASAPIKSVGQRAEELAHKAARWNGTPEATSFRHRLASWKATARTRHTAETTP
ncbi:hypothetical protein [Actinocorallia sp. A-T 12471]|uniref:hypothetical protein n=1 Tax=Actinocorallia sp. A-T 12471 TaxID=3089813 RepID=UPI0029D3A231|nr:hypothetical protein [Actinocorallia sp. A-T 12471]MDX6739564.1 hypothetical protein [Actinocorallia sp. A-T 12471]